MVGRRVLLRVEKGAAEAGAVKLAVKNLTVKDSRGVTMVDDISFDIRAGEIVGIAGVAGNGQSELLEAISGIRRAVSGSVMLDGKPIDLTAPPIPASCATAGWPTCRRIGTMSGWCWPSRKTRIPSSAITTTPAISKGRSSTSTRSSADAKDKIEKYDIRPGNPRLKTANFSGGNQQKIVLAREIEQDPGVLIVGQPTRGVDVGAIEFIHKRLIAMRDQGKACWWCRSSSTRSVRSPTASW